MRDRARRTAAATSDSAGEERDRVAVDRPDEAVDAVPAEPGTPVEVRLDEGEGERARDEEQRRAHGDGAGGDGDRCRTALGSSL